MECVFCCGMCLLLWNVSFVVECVCTNNYKQSNEHAKLLLNPLGLFKVYLYLYLYLYISMLCPSSLIIIVFRTTYLLSLYVHTYCMLFNGINDIPSSFHLRPSTFDLYYLIYYIILKCITSSPNPFLHMKLDILYMLLICLMSCCNVIMD